MEALERRFLKVVSFADDEIDQSCARSKSAMVDKFLDKEVPVDFIVKEMKVGWGVEGHFQVSTLS